MNDFKLQARRGAAQLRPLVLVIMDGVGLYRGTAEGYPGNAVDQAATPNLDRFLRDSAVSLELKAHGTAVGLPSDDDMGNSEVGHNTIGGGRVFEQGAKLVNRALETGSIFGGSTWLDLVSRAKQGGTFHLIGLLSDGNVHSHIDQLFSLIRRLAQEGVSRIRVHPLADGRDVDPVTYHEYVGRLEHLLGDLRNQHGVDGAIASGGGRMVITMDRYGADWDMVRRGWLTHVLGQGRGFRSAGEAIGVLRAENPGIGDQNLPAFVVVDDHGEPIGSIQDGDAVVFFNFRGDRAIEFSRAMTEGDFVEFDRGRRPDVAFAGMMEYDGDLHIPPHFLVTPPAIDRTISEYLVNNEVTQLAVAETQKFGHVTYFWNGNNSEQFDETLEQWIEIPSDTISFDQAPEMKAYEVCKVVESALRAQTHQFIRVNFANGDMVGHTGSLAAAVKAMEVVDDCLGRLEKAVYEAHGLMVVTADHGNADMMLEVEKKTGQLKRDAAGQPVIKTSHTLSAVPLALVGQEADRFTINPLVVRPGLANIASTLLVILGFEPPGDYLPSLVVDALSD